MTAEIKVLDHGWVRLVEWMGTDLSPVRSARQSYGKEDKTGEDVGRDMKLLGSLIARGHTSPFEAQTFTIQVQAPIFVFRQWHRHRTQSYNELSARYTEMVECFYTPAPELVGTQDEHEKQARNIMVDANRKVDMHPGVALDIEAYQAACKLAFQQYRQLLQHGWPRELARACLPVSTYSRMSATMNMLNFVRFARLRLDSHAQYEIRVYAEAMVTLLEEVYPQTIRAWAEVDWDTVSR